MKTLWSFSKLLTFKKLCCAHTWSEAVCDGNWDLGHLYWNYQSLRTFFHFYPSTSFCKVTVFFLEYSVWLLYPSLKMTHTKQKGIVITHKMTSYDIWWYQADVSYVKPSKVQLKLRGDFISVSVQTNMLFQKHHCYQSRSTPQIKLVKDSHIRKYTNKKVEPRNMMLHWNFLCWMFLLWKPQFGKAKSQNTKILHSPLWR